MSINTKDVTAGVLFIAIGMLFGLQAYTGLDIGTPLRMGPGYFPILLSAILILIGAIVALNGIGDAVSPITHIAWRGLPFILVAPIAFGLTVKGAGFIPAIVLVVAISAFASRRTSFLMASSVTVGMTLFCIAVFHYALGLPVRLLGSWIVG